MKQFQITELPKIESTDLANIFNVYDEQKLGSNYKSYSVNRTLSIVGLDNISEVLYKNYEIQQDDTWSLISYKNYGTTRLWWLICKTNNIINPTEDPIPGKTLRILADSMVNNILNQIKNN